MAPDCRATSRPFRNAISVGMLRMPKRAAIVGLALGVELRDPRLRRKLRGGLLVRRRHHPARPAPWRPEIHDQRQIVARDVAVEARRRQLDRTAGQQRPLAAAAIRARVQALAQHAVGRVAMRTDDAQMLAHERASRARAISARGGRSAAMAPWTRYEGARSGFKARHPRSYRAPAVNGLAPRGDAVEAESDRHRPSTGRRRRDLSTNTRCA